MSALVIAAGPSVDSMNRVSSAHRGPVSSPDSTRSTGLDPAVVRQTAQKVPDGDLPDGAQSVVATRTAHAARTVAGSFVHAQEQLPGGHQPFDLRNLPTTARRNLSG